MTSDPRHYESAYLHNGPADGERVSIRLGVPFVYYHEREPISLEPPTILTRIRVHLYQRNGSSAHFYHQGRSA